MAVSKPCPKCQHLLEIPQPIPEQIACPKCGAVFKSRKHSAPTAEETPRTTPAFPVGDPAGATQGAAVVGESAADQVRAWLEQEQQAGKAAPAKDQAKDPWYFQEGKQRSAPCSLEELKQLVGSGKLRREDMVWRNGLPKWCAVGTVPELAAALPSVGYTAVHLAPGEEFQVLVDEEPAVAVSPATPLLKPAPPVPVSPPAALPKVPVPVPVIPAADLPKAAPPAAVIPVADLPKPIPPVPVKPAADLPKAAPPAVAIPATAVPQAVSPAAVAPTATPRRSAGFLKFLHASLPKPVLFGLYGALGGLVGVLLLGELLWAVLHPAPPVVEPLTVAVPPTLFVFPGSQNTLTIKIARQGVEGPVRLEVLDLPKGIEIAGATIAEDSTTAELQVKADALVATAHHQPKVRATTADGANVTVSEPFRLTVLPAPPTLKLAVSSAVTVYAGDNNRIRFRIARRLFEDPVRLEVLDLPKGVEIPLVTLPEKVSEGALEVKVGKSALLGFQRLRVQARSLANHKVEDYGTVMLTIEPPPGKLRMTVSDKVTVFAGAKNKFTVLVAVHEYKGPVQLEVEGLPPGVASKLLSVNGKPPEGENNKSFVIEKEAEATLEVDAGRLGSTVQLAKTLTVYAKVPNKEDVFDSKKVELSIVPHPSKLNLTASPQVTVFAGDKNTFTVQIARGDFKGPVYVEAEGAPARVRIAPVIIPPDKTEATLVVDAGTLDAKTPGSSQEIRIHAKAQIDGETIASDGKLQLKVEPHPGKLTMTVSPQVKVFPGDENQFTVRIARGDFKEAVKVEVRDVPAGVSIPSVVIPPDKTEATLTVNAKQLDKDATLSGKVRVFAKADTPKEDISAAGEVQLRIEPPPPTLQLSVPPLVKVYPGGKARFAVKIERHRYKGPVIVEATGPGSGPGLISLPALTLAENVKEGEMEVTASENTLFQLGAKSYAWQVTARAADGKGPSKTEPFQLKLETPDSELKLSVSDKVEVHQGAKCKFTVKVARGAFRGKVGLEFIGVPEGVLIPETLPGVKPVRVEIPDGVSEMVVDGWALLRAKVAPHKIKVRATGLAVAPDGKTPTADGEFTLDVKPLDPSKRPPPLDVVFVLDVTDSMDAQIKGVRDGVQQFIKGLTDNEMEARIGLVAFRDIQFTDFPAFTVLEFKDGKFTKDYKEFSAEVNKLKAAGGGDEPESSLNALKLAAEFPFAANARRVLILITDATYQTEGNSITMGRAQQALKEGKVEQVHLIIKQEQLNKWVIGKDKKVYKNLPGYEELHKGTIGKGSFFDLDKATTGTGKGFADILPVLSDAIASTIQPAGPALLTAKAKEPEPIKAPKLDPVVATAKPMDEKAPEPQKPATAEAAPRPGTAPTPKQADAPERPKKAEEPKKPLPPPVGEVKSPLPLDPQPPEAARASPPRADLPTLQGVQSDQLFAEKDRLQLFIAIALWTAALAGGIALALVTGQKLYLHQAWPGWSDTRRALLAGLAAGVIGGLLGQWFFQTTAGVGGRVADVISRMLAWAILGGLLGGGMAFFVPNMNMRRAFLGGCLGGGIGALGFALFSLFADAFLGRLIGAVLVGFCIGLMIALAEVAFRRYWLEIAFGAREIRTVTLGAATVTLGGNEKLAGFYVPEAPPRAFGYRVDKNRVFCEDFATGKTTEVPPGDLRHLAGVRIKVCSAASAKPTGASLQLVLVRDLPLMEGMPLTSEDIPGLEPQGADGMVALVSPRPNNPRVYLLRNRSKQSWVVTDATGNRRTVESGSSIELTSRCEIDFGQAKGTLDPIREATKQG